MSHNNNTSQFNQKPSSHGSELIEQQPTDSLLGKATAMLKDFANVSSLLRILGAIAVLASMSMFLMQGWHEHGDFQRFCIMVAQTALLGTGGIAMVKLLREHKGARLFFGLALVSVTANFTTLGALIYSVLPLDTLQVHYPNFAHWQAGSLGSAVLSLGIGLVLLLPLSWLSFSVLVRSAAKPLTLWFAAMNLLLLLPVREPAIVLAIASVAGLVLAQLFIQKQSRMIDHAIFTWKTQEGRYARLILFVPLIIMVVRSVWHYNFDSTAELVMTFMVYAVAVTVPKLVEHKGSVYAYLFALLSGFYAATLMVFEMPLFAVAESLKAPLFVVLLSGVSTDLYCRSQNTWAAAAIKNMAAVFFALCLVANHLEFSTFATAIIAMLMAAIQLLMAMRMSDRVLAFTGAMTLIAIPLLHIATIVDFVLGSGWLGFAIGGISVIVLASLLDRYGAIVKLKLSQSRQA